MATNSDDATTTNRRLRHSPCNSTSEVPDELSTAHIPEIPRPVIVLPILALVIAGMSAYLGSLVQDVNVAPVIVATITIVAVALAMLVEYCRTTIYNYWASLVFNVCFMGAYSAVIAVIIGEVWAMGGLGSGTRYMKEQRHSKPPLDIKIKNTGFLTYGDVWSALLILSALELAIFTTHLIILSIYIARHRKDRRCCIVVLDAESEAQDHEENMGMAEQEAEPETDLSSPSSEEHRRSVFSGDGSFHEQQPATPHPPT